MIRGIGIDICGIERMKKALSRGGFAERVFSPAEIDYAGEGGAAAAHFAAAFAAREALAKAGGWGLASIGLGACEVLRSERGPAFNFSGEFRRRLEERGVKRVFLSITHEAGVAAAVVVLEGD